MPSGQRPRHQLGGIFSSPTRLDRTFKVFLNSRVGAVLPASGYMSTSDARKYIKKNTDFKTRVVLGTIVHIKCKTHPPAKLVVVE